jgi:hypothetical protein
MVDPQTSDPVDSPTLARKGTVDAVVAALLLAIGAVVMVEARRLGAEWTTDGPGAGYFPFYISVVLCVAGLGIFYQAVFSKARDGGAFVNRVQTMRVLSVLVPAAIYILGVRYLGLYVASAIYIALFMVVLGKYAPARSVLLALVVNAVFFLMFEVWFKVPLFKGTLDPLRFLGY